MATPKKEQHECQCKKESKWIDTNDVPIEEFYTYRITFECYPDEFENIKAEIADRYGCIIKTERLIKESCS